MHTNLSIQDRGITGLNDIHQSISINFGYSVLEMGKYLTKLHPQYTLFAKESHYNASMPNFAKVVLFHFTSNFNYFQVFSTLPKRNKPNNLGFLRGALSGLQPFPFPYSNIVYYLILDDSNTVAKSNCYCTYLLLL